MNKTSDAFKTISEAAVELDLPQHVLRFWETRFHQIKPMKRGGGRRYYRPDDVILLSGIKHLLYNEGYTIKAVQRLLKEHGNGFVLAVGRGGNPAELMAQHQASSQSMASAEATDSLKSTTSLDLHSESTNQAAETIPEDIKNAKDPDMLQMARSVMPNLLGLGSTDIAVNRLSADDKKNLQDVLFELLECKRILDQAR